MAGARACAPRKETTMVTKTAHDLEQDNAEADRSWRRRAQELRHDLERQCPAGRVLDRAHLVVLLRPMPSSNRPFLMWAYLALHGARALGLDMTEAAAALALAPETAARFLARDVWWEPPAGYADELPEAYRPRVIGSH
jgi:hypothetical protein